MNNKEKEELPDQTGNDSSEGDAREEGRMDKDEDLKKGEDKDAPISKPFTEKGQHITPHSLSSKEANNGHTKRAMDEHEEPDPTATDAPDILPSP